MARPRTEINWDTFDSLCAIQCTLGEIAAVFKCSPDTIESAVRREKKRRFSEYFNEKRVIGKVSLRRKQYRMAVEKENITMLIWLGKNYLAQTDKNDVKLDAEVSGHEGKPIEIIGPQDWAKKILATPGGLEAVKRLEEIFK